MTKYQYIQNAFGALLGIVGGAIHNYSIGIKLFILTDYLPDPKVLIPGIISAAIYGVVGYYSTKICRYLYNKLKLKFSKP